MSQCDGCHRTDWGYPVRGWFRQGFPDGTSPRVSKPHELVWICPDCREHRAIEPAVRIWPIPVASMVFLSVVILAILALL